MPVTRECTAGRNKSGVNVDVTGKQEFLRYHVCITQGAKNDAVIVDDEERIILDEHHEISTRCRQREWPGEGQSIEVGDHEHVLVLVFVRAVAFMYQVTLHNQDGSIKQWIKDCTYERSDQTDHTTVGLAVSVK